MQSKIPYYKILGLESEPVNFEEVKNVFRKYTKIYHPDKNSETGYFYSLILEAYQYYKNLFSKETKNDDTDEDDKTKFDKVTLTKEILLGICDNIFEECKNMDEARNILSSSNPLLKPLDTMIYGGNKILNKLEDKLKLYLYMQKNLEEKLIKSLPIFDRMNMEINKLKREIKIHKFNLSILNELKRNLSDYVIINTKKHCLVDNDIFIIKKKKIF